MTRRRKTPTCAICGCSLGGTRLVLAGRWTCPDCAYELEHGPAERVPVPARRSPKRPQGETLFPLTPYER
jgi:hypothetical protein